MMVRITYSIKLFHLLLEIRRSNFSWLKGLLVKKGMLASSLGAEVLKVGMVVVGMDSGTSCASIPLVVATKVENGSYGGAMGALGISGLPTLCVLALELTAFDVFGNTPSITSFLECDEVGFGANCGIDNPC